MTVDEKRNELISHCESTTLCFRCQLNKPCVQMFGLTSPREMSDEQIETLYDEYEKLKGDKTMEERTITITTHEYKGLVSDQAILAKLEVYTETHEYLNDDVIRTLLGTQKPLPARIESEGD